MRKLKLSRSLRSAVASPYWRAHSITRERQNAFGVAGRVRGGLQCGLPGPSRRRRGVVVVSGRRDPVHRTVLAKSASDLGSKPRASSRGLSVAFVVEIFSAKRAAAEEQCGSVGGGQAEGMSPLGGRTAWRRRHDRCTQHCDGWTFARCYPRLGPGAVLLPQAPRGVSQSRTKRTGMKPRSSHFHIHLAAARSGSEHGRNLTCLRGVEDGPHCELTPFHLGVASPKCNLVFGGIVDNAPGRRGFPQVEPSKSCRGTGEIRPEFARKMTIIRRRTLDNFATLVSLYVHT